MTYMLAITLCAIVGPSDAECETVAGYMRADRMACEELRQPMLDHLKSEADAAGMRVLFIGTKCKKGMGA